MVWLDRLLWYLHVPAKGSYLRSNFSSVVITVFLSSSILIRLWVPCELHTYIACNTSGSIYMPLFCILHCITWPWLLLHVIHDSCCLHIIAEEVAIVKDIVVTFLMISNMKIRVIRPVGRGLYGRTENENHPVRLMFGVHSFCSCFA